MEASSLVLQLQVYRLVLEAFYYRITLVYTFDRYFGTLIYEVA